MPRQSTKSPTTPWGKYVEQALAERGLNSRSQFRLTGIGHSTVNDWLDDHKPGRTNVVKFATGFGKDPEEALRVAFPSENGEQILYAGLYQIIEQTGRVVTYSGAKPASQLTPDEAREYLAIARADAGLD